MTFAQVALDLPLATVFDYFAPTLELADIGRRVIVPFGRDKRVGIIVGHAEKTELAPKKIKSILSIDRDCPPLGKNDLALLRFAADYYHHPFGQTIFSALPPAFKRLEPPQSRAGPQFFSLTARGKIEAHQALSRRAVAQQKILAAFNEKCPLSRDAICAMSVTAPRLLRDWLDKGWLEIVEAPREGMLRAPHVELSLNAEQRDAVETLSAQLDRFQCWLLHGITGSGKTEVYLQVVEQVVARGGQALILVPEISLTPQLEARFRARFPDVPQVSLHSALGEGTRYQAWRSAAQGQARIVLGTRLAVFTPLPKLALIVVDEEHDASFKQQEGLRYSARDLAVYRANALRIPIVLGSATPSLESWAHAQRGHYRLLTLKHRAHRQSVLATVKLIDTRVTKLQDGLTPALKQAISQRLERREQSLIFINRRGYAPVIHCRSCGWMAGCPRCSTRLVFHLKKRPLRCHLCGHIEAAPEHCPQCGNLDLRPVGEGTQRIEAVLGQHFPTAKILRLDRDSVTNKEAWQKHLDSVADGAVDILVGTQMLAKGHDFPRLTLVGMINVDSGLYSTDYRAAERTFAMVMQVAGRAGRAEHAGEVLIQTEFPAHPLFRAAVEQDFAGYAEVLLQERSAALFPPYIYQAVMRMEATALEAVVEFSKRAKQIADTLASNVTVFQPVEANIQKIAGKTRYQIVVQANNRAAVQNFLRQWREALSESNERKVRWSIDVDPLDL